ncbi:MAG: exonuclease domain-containing protein [Candidatus Omnitrophica bacterium]|jgi:DNA polymerase III epsilon subunit family exonuclease|nr:exonuclease domain-containing protein [Candidatus Omnitrophota bacterium]
MNNKFEEAEFTIYDTETTGLDPGAGDRIVEIAAIRIRSGKRLGSFQSFIDPGRPVSPAAFAVNKISPEMLNGAPLSAEVLPKFLEFIKGSCLCSYNAGFDMGFLREELALSLLELPQGTDVVDILTMSRKLLPGLGRYPLWAVAEALGIKKKQKHRAMSDVEMTLDIFNRLVEVMKQKSILEYRYLVGFFGEKVPGCGGDEEKLTLIKEAIAGSATLKIKYLSSVNAGTTERRVIPRQIKQDGRCNYLVGFCCLKSEERTFRIDNILDIRIE